MKRSIDDLAIFGGSPSFKEELHVGRPNIGNRKRLIELINDMLDRKWLTNNGPCVEEFERSIAEMIGARHCIAMCNGTIALEIAIRASELTGEVIVPSFTFIATAHALQWQGITPVFCDIDITTHNIDPAQIEDMITPRTTGIIGVHLWGRPCDVEALTNIAQRRNLKLLFDAAHAFNCSYKKQMIGNFGNAEVFSFHATKVFNTFEGGAVITNDDDLANKIRLMQNFGFWGYDNVIYIGTNGKMNEVSAAMGLTSLECLSDFVAANYRNYKQYQSELKALPGITFMEYNETEKCYFQFVVLEINDEVTHVNRDQMQAILWTENILARRYFYPGCHRMEPYRSIHHNVNFILPATDWLSSRVTSLPTGSAIGAEDISKICEIVRTVVLNGYEIKKRFDYGGQHVRIRKDYMT